MGRCALRLGAALAVGLVAACAAIQGGPSEGAPRLSECPAFEDVDHAELMRLADPAQNPRVAEYDQNIRASVDRTPLPPEAAIATTRIRLRVPPTGMWARDNFVTVWRNESGVWFVARQDIDNNAPPPPPIMPPSYPPPADWVQPPAPPLAERFPVRVGPASTPTGAALDAALADSCMRLEPDRYTSRIPLRRAQDWVCVPDSSVSLAEIVQPERPTRLVGVACENRFLTSRLLQIVLGAEIAE